MCGRGGGYMFRSAGITGTRLLLAMPFVGHLKRVTFEHTATFLVDSQTCSVFFSEFNSNYL